MEGFYPIYSVAQSTFGVNWLLIASIHEQESAFSTAPSTYHGLNFAGCCGGPMQFNVTNGPVTTWDLVSDSYRYGARPAAYDHPTARHPVDLRRLRRDHGGCASALGRRRDARARSRARGTRRMTTTDTTRPASPTPTRCWRARSAGHSTGSARTAASNRRWSRPCMPPTARRSWPRSHRRPPRAQRRPRDRVHRARARAFPSAPDARRASDAGRTERSVPIGDRRDLQSAGT